MALFTKKQFDDLANEKGNYCISIYIPTQRNGENKESLIRLKNKVSEVEKQLSEIGLKPKEIEEYLQPLKDKLIANSSIWRLLSDALVVFRSKEKFEYYILPLQVDEFSQVSDEFYLLPLLNIFNQDDRFFILVLSLQNNKFYEATQNEITEISVEDIFPETYFDSAGHDVVQKSLEYRSRMPGKEFAPFHGKAEGKDYKETEMMKYLQDVDDSLNELLKGYGSPVVVASIENVFSHFKEISNYKNLYPKCVAGNYDNGDIQVVHEKAKELLVPYFDRVKNDKKENYSEAIGKTTSSLEDVVISADSGQIDTLFVARGNHVWGDYDQKAGKIDIHKNKKPLDKCLLDLAARNTFLKSGQVFIEEAENLPEKEAPVNAILRY